jgi:hypothetical protein
MVDGMATASPGGGQQPGAIRLGDEFPLVVAYLGHGEFWMDHHDCRSPR